jgi:hypothetical protein
MQTTIIRISFEAIKGGKIPSKESCIHQRKVSKAEWKACFALVALATGVVALATAPLSCAFAFCSVMHMKISNKDSDTTIVTDIKPARINLCTFLGISPYTYLYWPS